MVVKTDEPECSVCGDFNCKLFCEVCHPKTKDCKHENYETLIASVDKDGATNFPYNYDNGVDGKRKGIYAWCRDCGAIHIYKKNEKGQWRDMWRKPGEVPRNPPDFEEPPKPARKRKKVKR